MKRDWMNWIVMALFPTPPAPTTTSLYSNAFCTFTGARLLDPAGDSGGNAALGAAGTLAG